MLPDRVSNPGPLTYESGALPIALRGPAVIDKPLLLGINISKYVNIFLSTNPTTFILSSLVSEFC